MLWQYPVYDTIRNVLRAGWGVGGGGGGGGGGVLKSLVH